MLPASSGLATTSERLAIQLMIAQGLLFAAETAAIHQIGSRASLMQLSLIRAAAGLGLDRKSTRLNSSHVESSYAVFCLKKKKTSTCSLCFSTPRSPTIEWI